MAASTDQANTRPGYHFDPVNLGCAARMPFRLVESTASTGWRALLLNHYQGKDAEPTFETYATEDLSLTIAAAGRHEVWECVDGRWRSAIIQPGTVCVKAPHETARIRLCGRKAMQDFRAFRLYLAGSIIHAVSEEYRRIGQSSGNLSTQAYRDETLTRTGAALLAAHRAGAPEIYAESAALWMVTHLLARQGDWWQIAEDSRAASTITDRRLARVIEYMRCNLDRPLALADLAGEAGISIHHFARRFRERTGLGPVAHLTDMRMEQARQMLRRSDLPVAEIGRRCGYPRASTFATAFLRHTGHSPSDCRATR